MLDAAAARRPARHGRAPVVAARRVSRRSRAEARRSAATSPRRSPSSAIIRRCWRSRSATRSRPASCAGTAACGSSGSCAACTRTPRRRRPTSLFTYVNFPPTEFLDLSFFDICAFNVYLHREHELRAYLARLQHIAGQKPLLLAEAGADSIREGETAPGRDHRDAHPRRVRRRRLRRDRVRVDRRVVARRPSGRRLEIRPGRSRAPAEAGGARRSPRRSPTRRSRASASAPGRGSRWSSAPTTPPTRSRTTCARSSSSPIRTTRSSSSTTARRDRTSEIGHRFARVRVDRHAERRAERGAQRRAGRSDRRDRRLHRRRHPRRSRLADVPGPAVPDLRRRRLGRPERGAGRRSADRAVHRARAGRADARAARRSHRRARARLQHGVPPRRAAGDRRLQPDLPPRRRRCGRVLAAAGARLEDRLRLVGAGLASPPLVGAGLLAAAGRLRRRRDLADGAPSGEIPRRPDAVARPHLQPAAVRALALGHAHQRRRLGHGGVPVGLSHRRAPVRVPAALDPLAGDLVRSSRIAGIGVAATEAAPLGVVHPARRSGWSASPRRSRRTSPTRCARTSTRCAAASSGTGRRSPISISSSRWRASAAGSAACCRRRKSRCRPASRRPAAARGRRWPRRGARCC